MWASSCPLWPPVKCPGLTVWCLGPLLGTDSVSPLSSQAKASLPLGVGWGPQMVGGFLLTQPARGFSWGFLARSIRPTKEAADARLVSVASCFLGLCPLRGLVERLRCRSTGHGAGRAPVSASLLLCLPSGVVSTSRPPRDSGWRERWARVGLAAQCRLCPRRPGRAEGGSLRGEEAEAGRAGGSPWAWPKASCPGTEGPVLRDPLTTHHRTMRLRLEQRGRRGGRYAAHKAGWWAPSPREPPFPLSVCRHGTLSSHH